MKCRGVCASAAETEALLAHSHIAALSDHQMVEHVDVKHFPGADDLARHQDVFGAGVGSPEGWLWVTIMAALLRRIASLKTSPTRTIEAFKEPM